MTPTHRPEDHGVPLPSVGRTVLYQTDERGGLRYALPAIVTCTRDSHPAAAGKALERASDVPMPTTDRHVHLAVLTPGPGTTYTELDVNFSAAGAPRSWRWPVPVPGSDAMPAEHPDARGLGSDAPF